MARVHGEIQVLLGRMSDIPSGSTFDTFIVATEHPTWTEYFFNDCGPPFKLTELVNDPKDFKPFPYSNKRWKFGSRVSEDAIRRGSPTMALWLYAREKGAKTKRTYVAKTFEEYSLNDTCYQLRMIPSHHTVSMVRDQKDPFMNESRAYEHIEKFCSGPYRAYFPGYHGVIRDVDPLKFPSVYKCMPFAIVLEAIKPELASRRVLAAKSPFETAIPTEGFFEKLKGLCLNVFQVSWYLSLCNDRLRRVATLNGLGVIHGDVLDRHFRIPGDFYDTVLYDFSVTYTFSPSYPYHVNCRRPGPLSQLRKREQRHTEEAVLERAEKMDLRDHLTQSLQLSTKTVDELCTWPLENEVNGLELIIFKVMHRPDAFSMPSLASIFPFLEAVRPSDCPGWHINRARLLEHYTASWVRLDRSTEETSSMTLPGESNIAELERTGADDIVFILTLIPKEWVVENIKPKLLKACIAVGCDSEKPGSVTTRKRFEES